MTCDSFNGSGRLWLDASTFEYFCSKCSTKKSNDFFNCVHFSPQEQEDLALAQALAASEEEYRRQQQRQQVARNLSRQ